MQSLIQIASPHGASSKERASSRFSRSGSASLTAAVAANSEPRPDADVAAPQRLVRAIRSKRAAMPRPTKLSRSAINRSCARTEGRSRFIRPALRQPSSGSKMPGLRRLVPPVIVAAVEIFHGRGDQFGRRCIVERRQLDGDEIAADFRDVAVPERTHAAVPAEPVMAATAAELIIAQVVRALQQAERVGLDGDAPIARLGADRAIALPRAL